ncbi:MAG TPA: aminoglycoside phosphotransferase family protein [Acidimicrobiales bacterium]|nr:aminoglycoside phosphotransferase family protein [Acidimicrobiales bacterium]
MSEPAVAAAPAAELVARAFDLGEVAGTPTFAARGELGYVWRLDTDRGPWAVKRLVLPVDGTTGEDVDFQLAARAAGVRLPRPRRTTTGRAVAVGPDGVGHRVYEWIDIDPDGRVDPAAAGGLLGTIHGVGWPAGDIDPWYRQPPPEDRWPGLVTAARTAGAPWAEPLAARVDEIVATTRRATGVVPSQVIRCHLDFNADNVVADRAGRVWVIDWENSGGGDPAQELAQSLSAVAGTGDAAGAFLDGYRAAGGPGRLDDLDAFAMAFVVQASLVAFFGQRWLDDSNPRDAHRLADMLPNLLTLDRAHHLLDQLR